jgi:hypothetical protein
MGYGRDYSKSQVRKGQLHHRWKSIAHSFNHCVVARKRGFDELTMGLSSAMAGLCACRMFNMSIFIFNGLTANLPGKNKFLLYPRCIHILYCKAYPKHQYVVDSDFVNIKNHEASVFSYLRKYNPKARFLVADVPLFANILQDDVQEQQALV